MGLRLSETIQRILISSTSRFIAEYEAEGIHITHAWPGFHNDGGPFRLKEGPLSRSAYMISFVTPEVEKAPGVVIPRYEHVGDWLCSLLSLLYGKRFDSHGCVEFNGHFSLPNLAQFSSLCIPTLPQNDHNERSDIPIPLDLRQVARFNPMLMGNFGDGPAASTVNAAAKFYLQALQNAENDSDVAYLNLITAGEILANGHHPQNEDLLDEGIRIILNQVRQFVPDGQKAAATLAGQMRQIKRRFRSAVQDLIDERFFLTAKPEEKWKRLNAEDLADRVSSLAGQ